MSLLDPRGREITPSSTVNEILDDLFVPLWKKQKLSEDDVLAKKAKVIEYCTRHPTATRKELFEFMQSVHMPKPKVVQPTKLEVLN